ncbi:MAG: L-threonylcarbamoyladenylate synthase [Gammaproteobacteria bacterium]
MAQRFKYSMAAKVLQAGGLVAYPTEAVYGLGCDPHNHDALRALLALKRRSPAMGLIVISHSIDTALNYIDSPSDELVQKLQDSWPGPNTWIVKAQNLNELVTGGRETVALRVSAHPVCQQLCAAFGDVLVSTSANVSGKPPATNLLQLRRQFPKGIDHIVGGALGNSSRPTQIMDASTGEVLRRG